MHPNVALRLAFVAWHVFAGFAGTSLVYRWRFGRSPNVVVGAGARAERSRHRSIQLAMGLVSVPWAVAVVVPVLSPVFASHAVGRPLVSWPGEWGWIVAGAGHVAMVASQLAMGPALRVGLDTSGPMAPVALVTEGPFRWSRHPVYVGSVVFLIGEWIWNPNLACALSVVLLALGFDGLAREEDRYLRGRFGEQHAAWTERVRRYG